MVEIQLFESNQDSNSYTVLYLTTSLSTAKVSSSSGWMPLRGCSSILHITAKEGRLHLHIRLEGSLENDHFLEANYFTMVLLSNYKVQALPILPHKFTIHRMYLVHLIATHMSVGGLPDGQGDPRLTSKQGVAATDGESSLA